MVIASSWESVEAPILRSLAEADGSAQNRRQLEAATGIDTPTLMRALRTLKEDDYIAGSLMSVGEVDYPIEADGLRLTPKGKRQVGLWPADAWATVFFAQLADAIAAEPDVHKRSKLERVRDALMALGATTLNQIIGKIVGIGLDHA